MTGVSELAIAGAALASISAYAQEAGLANLKLPLKIDASAPHEWPDIGADAIFCSNMTHISPFSATEGLFAGAAQILRGKNLPLILYGPYFEQGVEPAPSNIAFDESLRSRNEQWGLREAEALDEIAAHAGFLRSARYAMPANNLVLVYRAS